MRRSRQHSPFDVAIWKGRIREANLRVTGGRLSVLKILSMADSPLSHSELVEALAAEPYDRATIFRNLNDLTDVGLVEKKDLGDHTWRFELRRETPKSGVASHTIEHPHFTCTDCGNVQCLPDASIGIRSIDKVPRAVTRREVRVTLQGLCDRCET